MARWAAASCLPEAHFKEIESVFQSPVATWPGRPAIRYPPAPPTPAGSAPQPTRSTSRNPFPWSAAARPRACGPVLPKPPGRRIGKRGDRRRSRLPDIARQRRRRAAERFRVADPQNARNGRPQAPSAAWPPGRRSGGSRHAGSVGQSGPAWLWRSARTIARPALRARSACVMIAKSARSSAANGSRMSPRGNRRANGPSGSTVASMATTFRSRCTRRCWNPSSRMKTSGGLAPANSRRAAATRSAPAPTITSPSRSLSSAASSEPAGERSPR